VSTQGAGAAIGGLPIAVDGSKNPESIPDDVAYRHFLLAIAIHENPSQDELLRRSTLVARVGLSKADHDAFVSALGSLREELDAVDQARTSLTAASPISAFEEVQMQERRLLDDAVARLRGVLSTEGRMKFDDHIRQYVKKRIKILGVLPR
jgi:hypothetical protein